MQSKHALNINSNGHQKTQKRFNFKTTKKHSAKKLVFYISTRLISVCTEQAHGLLSIVIIYI